MNGAAGLLLALNASSPGSAAADLTSVFRRVCMEGSARFAAGEAEAISVKVLPVPVRQFLERPTVLQDSYQAELGRPSRRTGSYFRVRRGGSVGFLAVETLRRRGSDQSRCVLASRELAFEPSIYRLEEKPQLRPDGWYGRVLMTTYSWSTLSSLGYRLLVAKLDQDYVALQTLLMGPEQTQRLIERINAARAAFAKSPPQASSTSKKKSR